MKHARIKTFYKLNDEANKIITNSYYENLASIKEEIEQHIQTSPETLLTDVINCLKIITGKKSKELTIKIVTDDEHHPKLITQIYTIRKENL